VSIEIVHTGGGEDIFALLVAVVNGDWAEVTLADGRVLAGYTSLSSSPDELTPAQAAGLSLVVRAADDNGEPVAVGLPVPLADVTSFRLPL
jgi:hypothetical protein